MTLTGASLAGTDANNYRVTNQVPLSANITAKKLTVSGGTAAVTALGSDVFTVSGTVGTFNTKTVDINKVVTLTGATLTGSNALNYSVTNQAPLSADISPYSTTVSGLTATGRVYNATTDVTLGGSATITKLGNDDVTLSGPATGSFSSKNVGMQSVTVTGNTISGTDSGNYTLLQQSGLSVNIGKANATVVANSGTVTYNGDQQSLTGFTTTGVFNNDVLTNVSASGYGTNAGTYSVIATGSDKNYNLAFTPGKLTIAKANATILANSGTVTYTGLLQSVTGFTATGLLDNQTANILTGVSAGGSGINAGTYTMVAAGSDKNYNLAFTDGTLDIAKANLTLSGSRALQWSNIDIRQCVDRDGVNGETFSIAGSGDTSNLSSKDAHSNSTLASLTGLTLGSSINSGLATNYNALSTSGSSLTIDKKTITISGLTASKEYDALLTTTMTGMPMGWISGDDMTVSTIGLFDSKDVGTGKTVTLTSIYGGADLGNYTITNPTTTTTTADINRASSTVTVTANSVTGTYTGLEQIVTGFTATGLLNNESASVLTGVSASGSGTNAGNYSVVATGSDSNYNLAFTDGMLDIVTAYNNTGIYADILQNLTGLSATVLDINESATPLTDASANGTGTALATGTANSGNGTTGLEQSMTGLTPTGLLNNERGYLLTGVSAFGFGTNTGNYSLLDNGYYNIYNLAFTNRSLKSGTALVTGTASSGNLTYTALVPSLPGLTATDLINNESAYLLTGVSPTGNGTNPGTHTLVFVGSDSNYSLTFTNHLHSQ